MFDQEIKPNARPRRSFSLRSLFVAITVAALLLCGAAILHRHWQNREIVMAIQPAYAVSVLDAHLKPLAAACPSVRKLFTDHRSNSLLIVCQYRCSAAAREELSPYLADPQILKTAELLDMPLAEVLAMSRRSGREDHAHFHN